MKTETSNVDVEEYLHTNGKMDSDRCFRIQNPLYRIPNSIQIPCLKIQILWLQIRITTQRT